MKPSPTQSIKAGHQVLLSPEKTTLIIIDHQVAFGSCFDTNAVINAECGVAELVASAGKIKVPVFTSLVETNLIDSKLSSKLEKAIPELARFTRSGVNPWDDPAFADAVAVANRPCLLIAGLSAETSLSFTALCALERGFDVYVVRDACLGCSVQSIATTFERLTQAGVVPVSWRQVILEWTQGNVDAGVLRRGMLVCRQLQLITPPTCQQQTKTPSMYEVPVIPAQEHHLNSTGIMIKTCKAASSTFSIKNLMRKSIIPTSFKTRHRPIR